MEGETKIPEPAIRTGETDRPSRAEARPVQGIASEVVTFTGNSSLWSTNIHATLGWCVMARKAKAY
jgi:hypothetical protein